MTIWLVVWNMNGLGLSIYSIGNVIIQTDELIFFRGVGTPPTSRAIEIIVLPIQNGDFPVRKLLLLKLPEVRQG